MSTVIDLIVVEVYCVHQLLGLCVLQLQIASVIILSFVFLTIGRSFEHGSRPRASGVAAHVQFLVLILVCQPTIHFPETF